MTSAQTDSKTVLIVEDHALVAKFYRMALERGGNFTCVVTEDVPQILAHVAAGRVHVAVLDVSLANAHWQGRLIDGVELAQLMKQSAAAAGRSLPILLATAHAMSGDRENLLAASGADDYLEKPVFEAQMLVDKVRRLLRSA
ncbi:MAG: response regulator [Acidobacteria bacterium]|nr:response regulator [Acidobacteriota bacterium]MCL5287613.1 response regulator [Acidobacteriota bacterium]